MLRMPKNSGRLGRIVVPRKVRWFPWAGKSLKAPGLELEF